MPATEKTMRSMPLLHRWFAVSGVVLLVSTVWMFLADHSREWKRYQRTAVRIDVTSTAWRELGLQTDEAAAEEDRIQAELAAAAAEAIDLAALGQFQQTLADAPVTENLADDRWQRNGEALAAADADQAVGLRAQLLSEMRAAVKTARDHEDRLLGKLKFSRADRDQAVAKAGLLLRDDRPPAERDAQEALIRDVMAEVERLTLEHQAANAHRLALEGIVKNVSARQTAAEEAQAKNEGVLEQLDEAQAKQRSDYLTWQLKYLPLPGKRLLELPILDAFNSPRKIDNLWSNGLEIDYNFRMVRRFDRCTTCHRFLDRTKPGSATDPAFVAETVVDFEISPAASGDGDASAEAVAESADPPAAGENAVAQQAETATASAASPAAELFRLFGLKLADVGMVERDDVAIYYVRPESPAAAARLVANDEQGRTLTGEEIRSSMFAAHGAVGVQPGDPGLQMADVIVAVNGDHVRDVAAVRHRLIDAARKGETVRLSIRRGLENPFATHPRLDLYISSVSPHKLSDFACTICHDGQGSATAFKWASHTPNTERQRKDWAQEHGWFDNPHWIFPMPPERFIEATCLKCHHDVTELAASSRFPDAPAPAVTRGYDLIRKYGCYGCHEVNGFDGDARQGPDLRLEPIYFAAAQALIATAGFDRLAPETQAVARQLVQHPENDALRAGLLRSVEDDARAESPALSATDSARIAGMLRSVDKPGQMRKPGPSLRHVASKLPGNDFLYDWINDPTRFRPSTRMPKFFGLWSHLPNGGHGDVASQYEPLEILGMVTYLQDRSQALAALPRVADAVEPSVERGKDAFQLRGCLACHTHGDFADAQRYRDPDEIIQGPDLTGIGTKLDSDAGRQWLYGWIKEPTRYHPRTVMPNLFLDPFKNEAGELIDPAADIVAYLSESKSEWQVKPGSLTDEAAVDAATLDAFVQMNLAEVFAVSAAQKYATDGVPEAMRGELKGAEIEMVRGGQPPSVHQKLLFVGRKAIGKYGCYGCHDIPGFEDAKPIGTALTDWGRKDPSRLAFEHITHYLGGHGAAGHDVAGHDVAGDDDQGHDDQGHGDPGHAANNHEAGDGEQASGHDEQPAAAGHAVGDGETPEMHEFYHHQIVSGHRAGFLYQKLREPRSYDFHKTEHKTYNQRLLMPQFPFTAREREAVVTFVLGLVADPPSSKYIYQPDARQAAILAGKRALEKYNCGGCHVLEAQRWQVAHQPDAFGAQSTLDDFPYLAPRLSPEYVAASQQQDAAGLRHAALFGMPAIDDATGQPLLYDDQGDPVEDDLDYQPAALEMPFDLWRPTAVDGHAYQVGLLPVNVRPQQLFKKYPAEGGFLARYLVPHATKFEQRVNAAAKGTEAWGWLPPPLLGEGEKVQTKWLHDFLLNPTMIRPAAMLRMPRFNLSSQEATELANYFAALDGAAYPYDFSERRQGSQLAAAEAAYQQALAAAGKAERTRLGDAMRIVVDNNYCVKCHIVGDFVPPGADRAKAPNLARVFERLRPDYVRRWIANPKTILPYTNMPKNIPYAADDPHLGGVSQDLYVGTSVEQVDALVDLLMNYDEFSAQRAPVAPLVQQAAPPAGAEAAAPPATSGGGE